MNNIKIDFWELVFLTEACIPPTTNTREQFITRLINEISKQMNHYMKARLGEIIRKRKSEYKTTNGVHLLDDLSFNECFNGEDIDVMPLASLDDQEFSINFNELCILAEVCMPPSPIARSVFWAKLTDEISLQLTESQKAELFKLITEKDYFNKNNRDAQLFYARFNPQNQYVVSVEIDGLYQQFRCWLFEGNYRITTTQDIIQTYIFKVEKYREEFHGDYDFRGTKMYLNEALLHLKINAKLPKNKRFHVLPPCYY